MDPRKFGQIMNEELDTRYMEERPVRGKTGYVWNNRHARKAYGMKAAWLGYDVVKAAQKADALNKTADNAANGLTPEYAKGSLGWWIKKLQALDENRVADGERSKNTQYEVDISFERLLSSPMAKHQMAGITGRDCKALHKKFKDALGVGLAHSTMKWLRYAFNVAVQEKELGATPLKDVKFERSPPRQVIVWEDEVARLVKHFHGKGRPELAWAIQFSFDTCQREGDVLKFTWKGWDRGDVLLKQRKTGAYVRVMALPELVAAFGQATKTGVQVCINPDTGKPYTKEQFSELANDGFRDLGLKCEDTGKQKLFHDLRRSGVVRLALAKVTREGIAAISGHSYQTIDTMLETYLPRTTAAARQAIETVLASREKA